MEKWAKGDSSFTRPMGTSSSLSKRDVDLFCRTHCTVTTTRTRATTTQKIQRTATRPGLCSRPEPQLPELVEFPGDTPTSGLSSVGVDAAADELMVENTCVVSFTVWLMVVWEEVTAEVWGLFVTLLLVLLLVVVLLLLLVLLL